MRRFIQCIEKGHEEKKEREKDRLAKIITTKIPKFPIDNILVNEICLWLWSVSLLPHFVATKIQNQSLSALLTFYK